MVTNLNTNRLNIYQMYKIICMLEDKRIMIESINELMEALNFDDRFEYIESTGKYRKSN